MLLLSFLTKETVSLPKSQEKVAPLALKIVYISVSLCSIEIKRL